MILGTAMAGCHTCGCCILLFNTVNRDVCLCVLSGVLRGSAVAVRVGRDAQDDSAGSAVGGARHLHPGFCAQGRGPVQMQVSGVASSSL